MTQSKQARSIKAGMRIDTDMGPVLVKSAATSRAPLGGGETVTLVLDAAIHPVHLAPGQRLNVVKS